MLRIALVYGAIAGAITIGAIILSLVAAGDNASSSGQAIGFLIMFIALSLIFFGIKSFREQREPWGFLEALKAGAAISLVATLTYVAGWELYLATSGSNFAADYAAMVVSEKEAAGAPAAEVEELKTSMAKFVENYRNPLMRIPITMTEIFPVGLLISLLSAWLLRRKPDEA